MICRVGSRASLPSGRAVRRGLTTTTARAAPGSPCSGEHSFPFARPAADEPPAEYKTIRRECPLARGKLFDGTPIWLITKMDDNRAVLGETRFSKVRTHPNFPEMSPGAKAAIADREASFVDMDPPEHTRFRGMFEPAFTPEACEALRPFVASTAADLVAGLERGLADAKKHHQGGAGAGGGPPSVDLAEAFSLPLAFRTIYQILGIPPKEGAALSGNVAVRASGSSNARDAAAAQQQIVDAMARIVDARIKDPSGDDIISRVVREHLREGAITRDQLVAHAFLLLVAGNATVASEINLGLVSLLDHPDQMAALRADPDALLPRAAEEICRYHTASAYALRRVALADVPLRGATIRAGEGIIALNQAANRDEDVFEDPERFDIRRPPKPNVAFGSGIHECIARRLSLVELEEAFRALVTRLPGLKLAVPRDSLEWSDPRRDVGLARLPVAW